VSVVQKRITKVGFGKQSVAGTPAAAATYDIGLLSGTVAGAEVSESDLNPTATSRVLSYVERTGIVPQAGFSAVAMPKSVGLLLLAACGAVTTTGSADPWTHTFKSAASLPLLTLFGRYDAVYYRESDAIIDELTLSFDSAGALKVDAKVIAKNLEFQASAHTITTAEEPVGSPPLIGAGGLFSFDGATARVKSGSVKVSNAGAPLMVASAITPDEITVGMQNVEFSMVVVPTDLTAWRKRLTGSTSGTTFSGDPYLGAVSLKWVRGATKDLQFDASKCALVTDLPDVDPSGGPVEITVSGKVLIPASGEPFTFVLRNDVAAY
jgi:hypothetical protein